MAVRPYRQKHIPWCFPVPTEFSFSLQSATASSFPPSETHPVTEAPSPQGSKVIFPRAAVTEFTHRPQIKSCGCSVLFCPYCVNPFPSGKKPGPEAFQSPACPRAFPWIAKGLGALVSLCQQNVSFLLLVVVPDRSSSCAPQFPIVGWRFRAL